MPAYLIGHIRVRDAARWDEYRSRVPGTLQRWRGELLFRGQRAAVLSGELPYPETVVLRFPDVASIDAWHRSPEYQALIPVREAAADVVLLSYRSED